MEGAIQFLISLATISLTIFVPNFAVEVVEASKTEVGLMASLNGLAALLSSWLGGRAADAYGPSRVLRFGLLASAMFFSLHIFASSVDCLLVARTLAGFGVGLVIPPLLAQASTAGKEVAGVVAWGSLGWGIGSLTAGVVAESLGYRAVFAYATFAIALAFVLSFGLSETSFRREISWSPFGFISRNTDIYLPIFLRHLAAFSIWTIFPLYLASLGATSSWIGTFYFLNTFAQFGVMRRIAPYPSDFLFSFGLLSSALTFLCYGLAEQHIQLIPVQLMLAISYSSLQMGALHSLLKREEEKATCIGLLNSAVSLGGILGPLLGGFLADNLSYKVVMRVASLLAFSALFPVLLKPSRSASSLLVRAG